MSGLYLLDEQWYDDQRITTWLNTIATEIDVAGRRVLLGTGQRLFYDRLILAMGSGPPRFRSTASGLPGSSCCGRRRTPFGSAAYSQQHGVRAAVVAGGGPARARGRATRCTGSG